MESVKTLYPNRLALAAVAWCVLFAVVHVYWAAGGAAGMGGEPAETAGEQAYIALVAALGLVGARVAGGFLHPPVARAVVFLARLGGLALLAGVVVGTGRWLADGSLNGDGAGGVVTTLYFLLGGVLFLRLALRNGTARVARGGAVA